MSTIARHTLEQYERIVASGALDGRRLELIDGEIRMMSPIGPKHENLVDFFIAWSFRNLSEEEVRVRAQNSIGLPSQDCVPEPDIAWVRQGDYHNTRPLADDVLLLIEIADTSVEYDLGEKMRLYARAGIPEYWVVDIPGSTVHCHREPKEGKYTQVEQFKDATTLSPLCNPQMVLKVGELFEEES